MKPRELRRALFAWGFTPLEAKRIVDSRPEMAEELVWHDENADQCSSEGNTYGRTEENQAFLAVKKSLIDFLSGEKWIFTGMTIPQTGEWTPVSRETEIVSRLMGSSIRDKFPQNGEIRRQGQASDPFEQKWEFRLR